MTPNDELNNTMLKKYINKHYKIYKITPVFPISKKHPVSFEIFDYEKQAEVSEWMVIKYLEKIFSVDNIAVAKAFKELVKEEVERLQRLQIEIKYE